MSDRNIKRAVVPVDPDQVLAKVTELPIATWQYLSDPESVRHMGPMAQDFKQAFGLGDSDRWYHSVDGQGVALASIQALAKLAAEQRQRLEILQRHNAALERRLRALEKEKR